MIENRNGERVSEITLERGQWCRYTSRNGTEYIVTNAHGRLTVTKPLSVKPIRATKEIKAARIYTA